MTVHAAYRIDFTEFESGWGQRPDGSKLYASKADAEAGSDEFVKQQREYLKGNPGGDYSVPGTPYMVEITKEEADRLAAEGSYWVK